MMANISIIYKHIWMWLYVCVYIYIKLLNTFIHFHSYNIGNISVSRIFYTLRLVLYYSFISPKKKRKKNFHDDEKREKLYSSSSSNIISEPEKKNTQILYVVWALASVNFDVVTRTTSVRGNQKPEIFVK